MACKLLAIDPIEGKAFYEEDDSIYHLRPLYGSGGMIPTTEEQMNLIVKREGYSKIEKEFSNIKELIHYVRKEYEGIRGSNGLNIPKDEQLKQKIQEGGDDFLIGYINKAISSWIPQGKLKPAKLLFQDIAGIHNIKSRESVLNASKKLYEAIKSTETSHVVIVDQIYSDGFYAIRDLDATFVLHCQETFTLLNQTYTDFGVKLVEIIRYRQRRKSACNMILCEL